MKIDTVDIYVDDEGEHRVDEMSRKQLIKALKRMSGLYQEKLREDIRRWETLYPPRFSVKEKGWPNTSTA